MSEQRAKRDLLKIISQNGECMKNPDVDMSPVINKKRPTREMAIAKRLCAACIVSQECAVYCIAVSAPPINGTSVLAEAELKQAEINARQLPEFVESLVPKSTS